MIQQRPHVHGRARWQDVRCCRGGRLTGRTRGSGCDWGAAAPGFPQLFRRALPHLTKAPQRFQSVRARFPGEGLLQVISVPVRLQTYQGACSRNACMHTDFFCRDYVFVFTLRSHLEAHACTDNGYIYICGKNKHLLMDMGRKAHHFH